MAEIHEILRKTPLFCSLSAREVEKLVENSDLRIIAPGEQIIRFGQKGRFLGVILSGEVEE